jgi:hypothetical protein
MEEEIKFTIDHIVGVRQPRQNWEHVVLFWNAGAGGIKTFGDRLNHGDLDLMRGWRGSSHALAAEAGPEAYPAVRY